MASLVSSCSGSGSSTISSTTHFGSSFGSVRRLANFRKASDLFSPSSPEKNDFTYSMPSFGITTTGSMAWSTTSGSGSGSALFEISSSKALRISLILVPELSLFLTSISSSSKWMILSAKCCLLPLGFYSFFESCLLD